MRIGDSQKMYAQCQNDKAKVSSLFESLNTCSVQLLHLRYDEFRGKSVILIGLNASAESTLSACRSAVTPVLVTRSRPTAALHLNPYLIVSSLRPLLRGASPPRSTLTGLSQCVERQFKRSALPDVAPCGESSLPELSPGLQ